MASPKRGANNAQYSEHKLKESQHHAPAFVYFIDKQAITDPCVVNCHIESIPLYHRLRGPCTAIDRYKDQAQWVRTCKRQEFQMRPWLNRPDVAFIGVVVVFCNVGVVSLPPDGNGVVDSVLVRRLFDFVRRLGGVVVVFSSVSSYP
uniref:Uncharacterized protein n=1 Tax=Romanomermis culicivorax TaxID=13658 RepID=A0A915JVB1_ROMCU